MILIFSSVFSSVGIPAGRIPVVAGISGAGRVRDEEELSMKATTVAIIGGDS